MTSDSPEELALEVEAFQNMLVDRATGGSPSDTEYFAARHRLLGIARIKAKLPRFVHTCRSLDQFWNIIKPKFAQYAERRAFIWAEFRPLLEMLEAESRSPGDDAVSAVLTTIDSDHVQEAWQKALDRRASDPEGAITAARTLLESVCKHVLDERGVAYDDGVELPKLYRLVADELNLAPSQHTEQVFRQILGGCQAVVEGLGAVRNKLSDAHGGGKLRAKPSSRHAELAVNLSGAMATFLVSTLEARSATE
ncbi:MAG: abortive infection family protein [Planctomycetes bacterium]|nr:abortive infection family protein [Planctomycetota bacterium]